VPIIETAQSPRVIEKGLRVVKSSKVMDGTKNSWFEYFLSALFTTIQFLQDYGNKLPPYSFSKERFSINAVEFSEKLFASYTPCSDNGKLQGCNAPARIEVAGRRCE
jgi:hypothetical protein